MGFLQDFGQSGMSATMGSAVDTAVKVDDQMMQREQFGRQKRIQDYQMKELAEKEKFLESGWDPQADFATMGLSPDLTKKYTEMIDKGGIPRTQRGKQQFGQTLTSTKAMAEPLMEDMKQRSWDRMMEAKDTLDKVQEKGDPKKIEEAQAAFAKVTAEHHRLSGSTDKFLNMVAMNEDVSKSVGKEQYKKMEAIFPLLNVLRKEAAVTGDRTKWDAALTQVIRGMMTIQSKGGQMFQMEDGTWGVMYQDGTVTNMQGTPLSIVKQGMVERGKTARAGAGGPGQGAVKGLITTTSGRPAFYDKAGNVRYANTKELVPQEDLQNITKPGTAKSGGTPRFGGATTPQGAGAGSYIKSVTGR